MDGPAGRGSADADAGGATRLAVAPGSGFVARRERALLYLPDRVPDGLLDRFRTADHDSLTELLTGFVLDDPTAAPSFVYLEWPEHTTTARIQVIVRGDIEVVSDLESMPFLSGAGSATWVEHRAPKVPDSAVFRCGAAVDADTDLGDGVVPAGGFELRASRRVSSGTPSDDPHEPIPRVAEPVATPTPTTATSVLSPEAATPSNRTSPVPDPADVTPSTQPADRQSRLNRIASLAAAGGDDSATPTPEAAAEALHVADEHPTATPPDTLGPRAEPDTDRVDRSDAERPASEPPAGGPPSFPSHEPPTSIGSTMQQGVRDEETLPESAFARPPARPTKPSTSRSAPAIELPDGSRHAVTGAVLIGRRPDPAQGRAPNASTVRLEAANHVSRTHVRITLEGTRMLASDCESGGGTVLVAAAGSAPVQLEPWQPVEIRNGDHLYLGGTETSIAVHGG